MTNTLYQFRRYPHSLRFRSYHKAKYGFYFNVYVGNPCPLSVCGYANASVLDVYFIDVGQGDSTLVVSGDGVILIDTGSASALDGLRDQLNATGVETIDYVLITHPHEDHDGNLEYLADNYEIGHLIMPEYADDEEDYGSLLREMVGAGTQIVYQTSATSTNSAKLP